MRVLIIFSLFSLVNVFAENIECSLTGYDNGLRNKTFSRFQEASLLSENKLKFYAKERLHLNNVVYPKLKECFTHLIKENYTDYSEFKRPRNLFFKFKNNYTINFAFWLERFLERPKHYWDGAYFSINTFVEKSEKNFLNNKVAQPVKVYRVEDNNTLIPVVAVNGHYDSVLERYFSLKGTGFYHTKQKFLFVMKSEEKNYVYGMSLQFFRKPHNKERFKKLDKQGKYLSHNATSWACTEDTHTNLVWENKSNQKGVHFIANKYEWGAWDELVNSSNKEKFCGFDDWRVPNNGELYSLTDNTLLFSRKNRQEDLLGDFFNFPSGYMWSKTSTFLKKHKKAYKVRFKYESDVSLRDLTQDVFTVLVRGEEKIFPIDGFSLTKKFH
jgi:hypothetical protein